MSLPVMTPEQRVSALQKAAAARKDRAELKTRIKSGEVTLADALKEGAAARMKVSALLEALPGVGKVRSAQLMERACIAGNRRVSGLGARQRATLEAEFAA